ANALLDTRTAGVVDEDERRPGREACSQGRGDLVGVDLARAAPGDGEVLARDVDRSAQNRSLAGHDPVGGEVGLVVSEVARLVAGEHARLLEGSRVKERGDPLTCRQLPGRVLTLYAVLAAALLDLPLAGEQ